ncbi:MAG: hypothetical protein Crog4KO_36060 [Crocinitomicaceae bacterium]
MSFGVDDQLLNILLTHCHDHGILKHAQNPFNSLGKSYQAIFYCNPNSPLEDVFRDFTLSELSWNFFFSGHLTFERALKVKGRSDY